MGKVLFFAILAMSMVAHANQLSPGWKVIPSLMYRYNNVVNGASSVSANQILGDGSLGVMFQSSPLFLGLLYSYDSTQYSGSSGNKDVYASYGASVGLLTENVYMIVTYLASSEYDATTSLGVTAYTGGNGFQFALGYLFSIGQSMMLGPQFSYRSLSYSQQKTPAGVTSSANYTYNTLMPYITMIISL